MCGWLRRVIGAAANSGVFEVRLDGMLDEEIVADSPKDTDQSFMTSSEHEELRLLRERCRDQAEEIRRLTDPGYQILDGFVRLCPYLEQVLGQRFILAVSKEFDYRHDPDRELLDRNSNEAKTNDPSYRGFRDVFRSGHGIRLVHSHISANQSVYQTTPSGEKVPMQEYLMPPSMRAGGLEIASDHRTAMYSAIDTGAPVSAAVPAQVLGVPLYSQAFPVFDAEGVLVGGVSFAVDISAVLDMAAELANIEGRDEDAQLDTLRSLLDSELSRVSTAARDARERSDTSLKWAQDIKERGAVVLDIAEQLNVLAINTAIEASKVGANGKGVSVIASKMKELSIRTSQSVREIDRQTVSLSAASDDTRKNSELVFSGASELLKEMSVLSEVSAEIGEQKKRLMLLVHGSLSSMFHRHEDIDRILKLVDREQTGMRDKAR